MSISILSNSDWEELYPAKEYTTERAKPLVLHFLLALGQPEETIVKQIDTLKDRTKLVAHDAKCHRLTPLIIAAMQGKEAIVDKLLTCDEVKKNINAGDEFGWTALHHAILVSDSIYKKLLKAGADENCKTNMLGTPKDIKALVTLDIKSRSLDSVFFEGKVLTEKQAEETFGFTYRDVAFFDKLKALWQLNPTVRSEHNKVFSKSAGRQLPKVSVTKISEGFYGLEAAEDLIPGRVIGEYGGVYYEDPYRYCDFNTRLTPEYRKDTAYNIGSVNGAKVGSAVRFINCGFPNTNSLKYFDKGVERVFIFASEDVKKGEPLYLNYGADAFEVSYGPQKLFNREKMHAFFRTGLKKRLKEHASLSEKTDKVRTSSPALTNLSLMVQNLDLASKVTFPLSNPIALLDLHFSGIVNAQEWKEAINTDEHLVFETWIEEFNQAFVSLNKILKRLEKIEANIARKGATKASHAFMLKHLESQPLMNLIKIMDWIEEEVLKDNLNFEDTIVEKLESYDWTKDEEHLFSYKNRRKALSLVLADRAYKESTNPQEYYPAKKKEIEAQRARQLASHSSFVGSEIERMLSEIEADIPSSENPKVFSQKLIAEVTELLANLG